MKKPKKPTKPVEPARPEQVTWETFEKSTSIYGGETLKSALADLEKVHTNCVIDMSAARFEIAHDDTYVSLVAPAKIKREFTDEQYIQALDKWRSKMNNYLDKLAIYEENMSRYNLDMKTYGAELRDKREEQEKALFDRLSKKYQSGTGV